MSLAMCRLCRNVNETARPNAPKNAAVLDLNVKFLHLPGIACRASAIQNKEHASRNHVPYYKFPNNFCVDFVHHLH